MQHLLGLVLAVILLFFAFGFMTNAAAERELAHARAESMIIRAQSESRLQAAQAHAITMSATLPHLLVLTGGCTGSLFAIALIVFAWRYRPARSQPQIVERQVIYLPAPDMARRDIWQLMSRTSSPGTMIIPMRPGERS